MQGWTRWPRSHIPLRVEGTVQPQMTAAEVTQLELQLAGLSSLLEFGCGGSTLVAARQVRRIVSVDSDPAWLAKVQADIAGEAVEFTGQSANGAIRPTKVACATGRGITARSGAG